MRTAVILAAGDGSKLWPYAEIRPKAMVPIANKPIAVHQTELLHELGFERIIIAGGRMSEQLKNAFERHAATTGIRLPVTVVRTQASEPRGTAYSLYAVAEHTGDESFLVLYGDTLLEKSDVLRLMDRFAAGGGSAAALVSPLGEQNSRDWLCSKLSAAADPASTAADLEVTGIMGHPRDGGYTHRFCAFAFAQPFLRYCASNSGLFTSVQVGMMPPSEGHLEMSLADWMADGHPLLAVEVQGGFFDIDKPWHILQANDWMVRRLCRSLTGHELSEGASIDDTAAVNGFVRLGPNSRIGKNVIVNGNIIVGRDTVIENGAILQGDHVIGDETYIGNYCYLSAGSTVGNRCVINHCAELDGIIMDTVYLYHYMEFYGIIGTGTDLGAATVCGTLRFDDGDTSHRIRGRRETPREHANAVYLGDYVRTGVNAILMPGVKVGINSIVGPGVLLQEDVPNRTIISLKQEHDVKAWGPERYGW
ncbi:glucose-1-phosphate thymidylyltransferase [Paenibacillus nasutitermitis]|uniref:Glucose-1-phosphate thymidylyltransferase n=2 Tax=Paenibacillus nasutitermitis TaxID=1652958 RepID=A0A916ZCN2_9BACL|nr:glucose-1-phosphate thymidylyltransferase [Paenibacillus nasutitermitis]